MVETPIGKMWIGLAWIGVVSLSIGWDCGCLEYVTVGDLSVNY